MHNDPYLNYNFDSSIKNHFCNNCLLKLEWRESFYLINENNKSIQRLCTYCGYEAGKELPDAYRLIPAPDQDT